MPSVFATASSDSARRVRGSSAASSVSPSFVVSGKTFTRQFAALYFVRLHALRAACHAAAEREGLAALVCKRLLDVRPAAQCILTGTLYKEQKLKPSILSEYAAQKKGQLPPTQHATSSQLQQQQQQGGEDEAMEADSPLGRLASSRGQWVSGDDQCVLEDESGRITLVAADPSLVRRLCTGVVVAALGVQDDSGRFHISRLLLPDMPPQPALSSGPQSAVPRPSRFVLLVSGLSFGCPTVDPLPLSLLADWCSGFSGQSSDMQRAASIAAVVVLGNSLHRFEKKKSKDGLKEVNPQHINQPANICRRKYSLTAYIRDPQCSTTLTHMLFWFGCVLVHVLCAVFLWRLLECRSSICRTCSVRAASWTCSSLGCVPASRLCTCCPAHLTRPTSRFPSSPSTNASLRPLQPTRPLPAAPTPLSCSSKLTDRSLIPPLSRPSKPSVAAAWTWCARPART